MCARAYVFVYVLCKGWSKPDCKAAATKDTFSNFRGKINSVKRFSRRRLPDYSSMYITPAAKRNGKEENEAREATNDAIHV